jgi:hypothetical protein
MLVRLLIVQVGHLAGARRLRGRALPDVSGKRREHELVGVPAADVAHNVVERALVAVEQRFDHARFRHGAFGVDLAARALLREAEERALGRKRRDLKLADLRAKLHGVSATSYAMFLGL